LRKVLFKQSAFGGVPFSAVTTLMGEGLIILIVYRDRITPCRIGPPTPHITPSKIGVGQPHP
jgi:hypothetical protein